MPERAKGRPAGKGQPPRRETLGDRIARLRTRAGGHPTAPSPRAKRVSRREREARKQRLIRTGIAIAGGLVVLVLLAGALNEWVLKPRAVLAEVAGEQIRRSDYWTAREIDLLEQARLYQSFADMVGPDQSGQYLSQAQASLAQIPAVRGSTDTDPATLNGMIDDRLYVRGAEAMGLAVTADEAELWLLDQFAPAGAPLRTPAPTPTLTPDRAAMLTATASAEALPADATPEAAALPSPPVLGDAGPAGTPAVATPVPGAATPAAEAATPVPNATPNPVDALATAEAGLDNFADNTLAEAGISRDDYLAHVAVPAVAREKVEDALGADVGQSAPQVHAAHILVATKDLADRLAAEIAGGADFAELARANSTDEGTAGNGGDLGWFVREEMVKPFADVAFSLEPGQTSEPFQTEFGWHIVRVLDTDPDRPLTDAQITRIGQVRTGDWLAAQRAAANVTTVLPPTPTPIAGEFVPPLNAPPAPLAPDLPATPAVATPVPLATPSS